MNNNIYREDSLPSRILLFFTILKLKNKILEKKLFEILKTTKTQKKV